MQYASKQKGNKTIPRHLHLHMEYYQAYQENQVVLWEYVHRPCFEPSKAPISEFELRVFEITHCSTPTFMKN